MTIYISQFKARPLASMAGQPPYDLSLVSVGFEERSRAIAIATPPPRLGMGLEFRDRHEDSYVDNRAAVLNRGYGVVLPGDNPATVRDEVNEWFAHAATKRHISENQPLRVGIDISSMTRVRIAAVVEACYAQDPDVPLTIDLLYAPAKYRPSDPPVLAWVHAKPVTAHFAGWDPDAAKPLLTVIGLGYEPNAAEGVLDYLTPDESVTFVPQGREPEYERDVEEANDDILSTADIPLTYPVEDPYRLLLNLERLVLSRIDHRRILFVPLGPKIFAAASLVAAQRLHPLVSVWRFSAGSTDHVRPAAAAGWVCGIRLGTRPEPLLSDPSQDQASLSAMPT